MTLDLAKLPSDLIEDSAPAADQASEPANEPACELASEATLLAEPTNPISPDLIPLQAIGQETAVYPSDNFIHALYGGFMGLPDLPGALLRANLWDSFIDAYTNPDLSHYFAHTVFPTA